MCNLNSNEAVIKSAIIGDLTDIIAEYNSSADDQDLEKDKLGGILECTKELDADSTESYVDSLLELLEPDVEDSDEVRVSWGYDTDNICHVTIGSVGLNTENSNINFTSKVSSNLLGLPQSLYDWYHYLIIFSGLPKHELISRFRVALFSLTAYEQSSFFQMNEKEAIEYDLANQVNLA